MTANTRSASSFFLWLALSLVVAAAWGIVSSLLQDHFSPLWVFPAMQGLLLGLCLMGLLYATQSGWRRSALVGAVLAAAGLITTQFYVNYRNYVNQVEAKVSPVMGENEQASLRGTSSFLDYLDRQASQGRPLWAGKIVYGGWVWVTWLVDFAIVAACAAVMVKLAFGRPYCARCQKWSRAASEGRLDSAVVAAAASAADGNAAKAPADFRLWTCPTPGHGGVLDLAYRVAREKGKNSTPRQTRLPLDAQQLARVQTVIQSQGHETAES